MIKQEIQTYLFRYLIYPPFFVKSSETKINFHQLLLTKACPFCIFAFESGFKVANQQPCRKVCTVILHCNFKNAVTMSNFFNNGQRMPNIFERARAYEDGNEGYIQQQRPKTNIVINTNRLWYGEDSTVSHSLRRHTTNKVTP